MSAQHRRGRGLPIKRDAVLFVFGLAGLAYQMITGKVTWPMVIVCGLMAGVPGLAGLVTQLRGIGPTSEPGSPSPPPSSSVTSSTS